VKNNERSALILIFQILMTASGIIAFKGNVKAVAGSVIMAFAISLIARAVAPWKDEPK
jgi:hypothetical protein